MAASTLSFSQAKLIEKVEASTNNKLVIPYQKYELPNGLILIVHEDNSDPIVHLDVTYHVGSNRELVGRSGFAHFFEHMMFQGSDNVADEQHIKTISEAGGTMNGTTNSDRTNYFETVPANQLEKMLWLEADRMGFLLDAVTQKKFEVQRATVKNERGQNYDNRPYGLVYEKTGQAMYPFGHPYSWPTIGYIEDLNRVNVDDLKSFFLRWYGPNNAVVTVAGDVKTADVVKLVEKYFGSIPRGPEVNNMPKQMAVLDKNRYISYEDNIRFPMIKLAFPSVNNYHPDEPALDVLADILGGGQTSLFYKNFEKPGIAVRAMVGNPCRELAGEFEITVLPMPGKSLAEMEKLIRETLVEFEKTGVTDDDLAKFKAKFETDLISGLEAVSGKGSTLAAYQTFTGNPNMLATQLEAYQKVTKEDVMRVYEKYIKNKPAVILSVYPKGKPELKAAEDNFTPTLADSSYQADLSQYTSLKYNKAKDTFDRSKQPAADANPVVKVPATYNHTFKNKIKLIGTVSNELPITAIQITLRAGQIQTDLNKAGLATLVGDMLNEGATTKRSGEDMALELEKLGASVNIYATSEGVVVDLFTLTKNLDAALKLVEEKIFNPKFDAEDFDRLKTNQLEGIANQTTQATVIANNVYARLLYGDKNIFGLPLAGNAKTVEGITLDDVKNFYTKYYTADNAQVVVVGNIAQKDVVAKLGFVEKLAVKNNPATATLAMPTIDKTRIYFVNKDKAPQSEIRIGFINRPYDATGDFYRTQIANFVLGGAFNSRINLNLREDKGWTYGARTGFRGSKYPGPFSASAGVKGAATDSSLVEFMKEIKNYADNGITDTELAFTKSSMGQADALKYETPAQKAGFLGRIIEYNLPLTYVDEQSKILAAITKAQVSEVAKKNLPYNNMVIVIVGDKAAHFDKIKKLGYEVVELDTDGNKVQ